MAEFVIVRTDLHESPEVLSIAATCGIPPLYVVGCLHRVWGWARRQADGDGVVGTPPTTLDGLTGVQGFADAMRSVGWLDTTDHQIAFPDPEKWISREAIKKAQASERQRRKRGRDNEIPACHAPVTQVSRTERDNSVTREDRDKRRERVEEENDSFVVVLGDGDDAEPELSADLRGLVSRRLAMLAGISSANVPSTIVGEVVGYTAGRAAKKHDAATWPSEAPEPIDRARMLSEAFDVAEANAQSRTVHGIAGYVLTVMESAITAGEYPSETKQPERDTRPAWQREREEQRQAKVAAVREARSRRETA